MAQIVKVQNKPEGIEEKQTKIFDKLLKEPDQQEDEDDEQADDNRPRGDLSKKGQPSNADQYNDFQKTIFVQKCKIQAANMCKTQKPYRECRDEELFQCIADLIEEQKVNEDWLNMEMNYNEDDLDDYDPKLEEDDEYRLELLKKDEKKDPEYKQKKAEKKAKRNPNEIIDDDQEDGDSDDDDEEDNDELDEDQHHDKDDDEEELNEEEVMYDYRNFDFLDIPNENIDESSNEEDDIQQGDIKVQILDEKDYDFKIQE